MSEKAVKELLEKYNIIKSQLPKILSSDPIISLLDPKTGDIIKIERISPTRGTSEYYRVVTDGWSSQNIIEKSFQK